MSDSHAKFQVPAGYKAIVGSIKTQLERLGFESRIRQYCRTKVSLDLFNVPRLISNESLLSNEFTIQNTTFLLQADYFGKLAKNATQEIKPLILHYAEQSLFAFFVYSVLSYSKSAFRHGLEIKWGNSWKDTKVKICNNGFFSRIIDCYTILGVNTHFSIVRYNKMENKFEEVKYNPYPFSQEPILSLEEIIEKREKLNTAESGHYYDVIDFILIFYASSLARYKPFLWHKILDGWEGLEIILFKKCFERFDLLLSRLTDTLSLISDGLDPAGGMSPLSMSDSETTNKPRF